MYRAKEESHVSCSHRFRRSRRDDRRTGRLRGPGPQEESQQAQEVAALAELPDVFPGAPALKDLADKLSDVFETRVKVEMGQRKGKITVEFASVDDLERIVAVMAPELATRRQSAAPAADADPSTPDPSAAP